MSSRFHPQQIIKFGLLVFAIFSPFSISGAQIGFGIALLGWILKILWTKRLSWQRSFWDKPIIFYLLAVIISVIFSQDFLKSLVSFKDQWLVLLFFLLVNNLNDLGFSRKLLDIIIGISVLVALYAISQHYTGIDLFHNRRLEEILTTGKYRVVGNFSTMAYAFYAMVMSLVTFCLASFEKDKNKQIFYYAASLILITGNLFAYTRSTQLGQVGGFLAFFLLSGSQKKKKELILIGIYTVVILLIDPFILIRYGQEAGASSVGKRLIIWKTSWSIFVDHPITGIGIGNYKVFFEKYLTVKSKLYETAHNDFLHVAVQSGILGLASFIWLWITAWISLKRKYSEITDDNSSRPLILAGLVTLPAFLVASQFSTFYGSPIGALLLLFVLGVSGSAGTISYKSPLKQSNLA